MGLKDEFNENGYSTAKINGFVLGVSYSNGGGSTTYLTFDFLTRVLITRTGSSDGGAAVTPFSQLERDSLIRLRDRLVDLGGHPPELTPEPATVPPAKKLNL